MDETSVRTADIPEALGHALSKLGNRRLRLARLEGLGLGLAVAALAVAALVRRTRRAGGAEVLASTLDRHGRTGGEILAGTELALGAPEIADPTSRALALESAQAAARRAAQYSPSDVLPARGIRRPWLAGGALGAAILGIALVWPGVFRAEALRLGDPLGDHPPYAPYAFAVHPGDARVRYSDPFTIEVSASGERLPAKAEWVVEREEGTRTVFPLIDQGEGKFTGSIGVVEAPFRYFVRGPEGRSRRFQVGVILTPRFERVEASLAWPAYTRKGRVEGSYPEGGLVGVKGTRVTLTAVSNRPLGSGRLVWKEAQAPPVEFQPRMGPEGRPDRVVGSFDILRDGRFELTLVDAEGNASREPFQGRVVLLADRRPTVSILEPPPESYATPGATVPVVIEADDDFGLSRVALFRSLNGSRDHGLDLALPPAPALPVRVSTPLGLKEWSLEPGDVIEFFALAADNDPEGAKTAQSKVHRLRIISDEEFRKFQETQQGIDDLVEKYRPINEALEKAKEEARKLEEALSKLDQARGPDEEAARREAREARSRLKEALEEAERLAREQADAPPVFDVEKDFNRELAKLARSLEALRKEGDEGMKEFDAELAPGSASRPAPQGPGRRALGALRKKLGGSSDDLEQGVELPLEVLEKVYRLLEYESRFTALALSQDDLARRTLRFKDRARIEDPEEREELRTLEEEERGLDEELGAVIQGIRDQAAKLPPGPPFDALRKEAEEFATAVVEAKAPESLAQALGSLGARAGTRSAEDTRRAADLLMSFVARCEGMGQGGKKACLKFQPSLSSGMGGTLDQLLAGKGLPIPGSGKATGQGTTGQGGSSSAQRSGGQVGLYGSRPARASSGGGRGRKGSGGAGRESLLGGTPGGEGSAAERTDLLYGGVPIEAVPGEYRAAVREFFRRVVEESGRERR